VDDGVTDDEVSGGEEVDPRAALGTLSADRVTKNPTKLIRLEIFIGVW
jgi:hypothetical protein